MRVRACLVVALLLAGCASSGGDRGPPGLVVALGDSITMAMNSAGEGDRPQHSWAVGLAEGDGVESFAERLRARSPDVLALNDARSGARVADVVQQARDAARQRPDLVLLLIGANDACAQPMTSAADYRARLDDVASALPAGVEVYALSVPDVTRLREAMAGNETARALWGAYRICPTALGGSDAEAAAVRARIVEYNEGVADAARAHGWATDGGAVFGFPFEAALVSSIDAFHPSLAGQARLADIAWAAGPYR